MNRPSNIKEKQAIEYIDFLEKEMFIIKSAPNFTSYMTLKNQIDDFNEQLTIKEDGSGRIDLFSDKDDKSFDRAKAYFKELADWLINLERLRSQLSPEEKREADSAAKMANVGMAEKLALKAAGK